MFVWYGIKSIRFFFDWLLLFSRESAKNWHKIQCHYRLFWNWENVWKCGASFIVYDRDATCANAQGLTYQIVFFFCATALIFSSFFWWHIIGHSQSALSVDGRRQARRVDTDEGNKANRVTGIRVHVLNRFFHPPKCQFVAKISMRSMHSVCKWNLNQKAH